MPSARTIAVAFGGVSSLSLLLILVLSVMDAPEGVFRPLVLIFGFSLVLAVAVGLFSRDQ